MRKITFLVSSFFILLNAVHAQEIRNERRGSRNEHQNGYPNYYAIDYRDA